MKSNARRQTQRIPEEMRSRPLDLDSFFINIRDLLLHYYYDQHINQKMTAQSIWSDLDGLPISDHLKAEFKDRFNRILIHDESIPGPQLETFQEPFTDRHFKILQDFLEKASEKQQELILNSSFPKHFFNVKKIILSSMYKYSGRRL